MVYEFPISKAEKLERTVSAYIKKWLGLQRCLGNIGLYRHSALELPISSLTEEYKCIKVRHDPGIVSRCTHMNSYSQTGTWEEVDPS